MLALEICTRYCMLMLNHCWYSTDVMMWHSVMWSSIMWRYDVMLWCEAMMWCYDVMLWCDAVIWHCVMQHVGWGRLLWLRRRGGVEVWAFLCRPPPGHWGRGLSGQVQPRGQAAGRPAPACCQLVPAGRRLRHRDAHVDGADETAGEREGQRPAAADSGHVLHHALQWWDAYLRPGGRSVANSRLWYLGKMLAISDSTKEPNFSFY